MIEKYQTLGMINEAYMLAFIFVGEKGDPGDIEQCECKFQVKSKFTVKMLIYLKCCT